MLKHINNKIVKEVWHQDYFEICKNRVSSESYNKMIKEINKIIDENKNSNSKIVVKTLIPKKHWLNSTWKEAFTQACAQDDCYAAQFLGLLVCQELILREETWYFTKNDVASNMIYFNLQ